MGALPRTDAARGRLARDSPHVVVLAEDHTALGETRLTDIGQHRPAAGALQAPVVPVTVQRVKEEPLQDLPSAAGAHLHRTRGVVIVYMMVRTGSEMPSRPAPESRVSSHTATHIARAHAGTWPAAGTSRNLPVVVVVVHHVAVGRMGSAEAMVEVSVVGRRWMRGRQLRLPVRVIVRVHRRTKRACCCQLDGLSLNYVSRSPRYPPSLRAPHLLNSHL